MSAKHWTGHLMDMGCSTLIGVSSMITEKKMLIGIWCPFPTMVFIGLQAKKVLQAFCKFKILIELVLTDPDYHPGIFFPSKYMKKIYNNNTFNFVRNHEYCG